MRIDLTITMGEDSKTMSLDEARGLYSELNMIFGNNNIANEIHQTRDRDPREYSKHIPEDVYTQGPDIKSPRRDDSHGANPKVEAARNRAAKATSGCGRR